MPKKTRKASGPAAIAAMLQRYCYGERTETTSHGDLYLSGKHNLLAQTIFGKEIHVELAILSMSSGSRGGYWEPPEPPEVLDSIFFFGEDGRSTHYGREIPRWLEDLYEEELSNHKLWDDATSRYCEDIDDRLGDIDLDDSYYHFP